jgi:hypothetical protein
MTVRPEINLKLKLKHYRYYIPVIIFSSIQAILLFFEYKFFFVWYQHFLARFVNFLFQINFV